MSNLVIQTKSKKNHITTPYSDHDNISQRTQDDYSDDVNDDRALDESLIPVEPNGNQCHEKHIDKRINVIRRKTRCSPLFCLSKSSFLNRSQQENKSDVGRLKIYQIFSFADKFDVFLMIIGTVAALLCGAFYPVVMYIFQGITDNLANLREPKDPLNISHNNLTHILNECSMVSQRINETEAAYDNINYLIKYYIIIGSCNVVLYSMAWGTWMWSAERQVRRIRYALFRNILRQEIGWFDLQKCGELTNRLNADLDKIKDGINYHVPHFLVLLSTALSLVTFTLYIGYKLTLIFAALAPIIILIFKLTIIIIEKYTVKEIAAFSTASSIAQEVLGSIRTVIAFHGQTKEEKRFAKNLTETKDIGVQKGLYVGLCQCVSKLLHYTTFAIVFWYGHRLTQTDCKNYSAGTVIVVLISCMVAIFSTLKFVPNFQNFTDALASGFCVFQIIDRQSKIDAMNDEGNRPDRIIGDIEFESVTFAYPTRPEISAVKDLTLKISSGKTVALVGASGCGKSTIIQLIQRFYDPDQGRILIDGKDIKTLNVAWLRSHIGVVSQDSALFSGSIEENIRLGKSDATDHEVQAAAKMANAHDFIMALPEKYKTLVGDKLSGGQKQRVAISRALISNPKILLLDEATSALDSESERLVQDALDRAKTGRTTIIIAHRLSTIQNADFIIGLEHGHVIEHGTHHDLLKHGGLYCRLSKFQKQIEHDREKSVTEDENEIVADQHLLSRQESLRLSPSVTGESNVNSNNADDNNYNDRLINGDATKKRMRFRMPFLMRILRFNAREWPWITIGTICALILGVIEPISAFMFSRFYGLVAEPDRDIQQYYTNIYVGIILILGLLSGIAQLLSNIGFAESGEALTMRMRKITFSAMIRQDMSYFDREENSVGALVARLSSDAAALKGMTGVRIGIIVQTISTTIIALIIAFISSWKLTAVLLCFVPVLAVAGRFSGQQEADARKSKSKVSSNAEGGQNATEAIENIRTVVALQQERHFIDIYQNIFNREYRRRKCRLHLVAIAAGIANSITYFADAGTFWYGSKLVRDGETSFENVFRVYAVITFTMLQIGYSMASIPDYAKAKRAAFKILELNKQQTQANAQEELGIILKEVRGNIEFKDVHFRYPTRPTLPVLVNLSLKCVTDGITALVGPSGSGKSTAIALLERFYEPLKGNILLDGHNIKDLNIRWLRSIIGLVQQEPILFDISIRDNIAYGDNSREVTQSEIEAAAKMANIHEFICSLPHGYETLCGTKGSQLSGGQKQRIAIARALVRSPKILLLDEATSALDNESEKAVQEVLDQQKSTRTYLIIAHRLSTIQNAEKIAVVDQGKIMEQGTHNDLLQLNGLYSKLIVAQQRPS